MKLALKLALAILPGALAVIAAAAVLDLKRDSADFEADQRSDDLAMARVLADTVGRTWEDGGKARALALLEPMRGLAPRFRIRWVDLERPDVDAVAGRARRDRARRGGAVAPRQRHAAAGFTRSARCARTAASSAPSISSEAPTDLRAHVRGTIRATLLTMLALSATMVLVTLLVGAWVVGRPVTELIAQARRVAVGRSRARARFRTSATSWAS